MLYLSKLATVLITPLGFCLVAVLLGALILARGARKSGLCLIAAGALLLWIAAMPITGRAALGLLERQYTPVTAPQAPMADVAIVLGGAVKPAMPPRPGPDLGEAADRVAYAAELYRAGRVKAVLVSGGNLPWGSSGAPEAEAIRALLIAWGVPAQAIQTEGASRTTAENARAVHAMWPDLGASSALLVTSGAHMPRALATFRKAGLPVLPAPADIRATDEPLDLLDVLPDASALKDTSDAVKEYAGYAVYWIRGDL